MELEVSEVALTLPDTPWCPKPHGASLGRQWQVRNVSRCVSDRERALGWCISFLLAPERNLNKSLKTSRGRGHSHLQVQGLSSHVVPTPTSPPVGVCSSKGLQPWWRLLAVTVSTMCGPRTEATWTSVFLPPIRNKALRPT